MDRALDDAPFAPSGHPRRCRIGAPVVQRERVFFEVLLLLPLIVPEIILAVAFAGLYGFAKLRFSFWTIVTTHVAFSLSYVILMVRSRMARLNPSLVEAAMDLGAGPSQTFFRIVLPHLTPAVLASSLMVFTISLDDYVITSFVAGAGNTTLPLQIYSMAKEGLTPEINAVCTLLMVVTLMMAFAAQWAQRAAVSWRKMMPALLLIATVAIGPLAWHRWTVAGDRQVLNLYIWSGYLAPDTLKVFEQRFQARVQCDLYDSVEALLAKLQSGNSGYDIVVPSDYAVQILQRQRLLSPSTKLKFRTWKETSTRSSSAGLFDPGNRYSVPYTWGTTGIGYRKDRVGQITDGWQVLWEERYRGKIVMLDDMRENFGAALKLSGFSINSRDPDSTGNREGAVGKAEAAVASLQQLKLSRTAGFWRRLAGAGLEWPDRESRSREPEYRLPSAETGNNALHRFLLHPRQRVSQDAGTPVYQLHARARNSGCRR